MSQASDQTNVKKTIKINNLFYIDDVFIITFSQLKQIWTDLYWLQNRCSGFNSKNTTPAGQDVGHNITFLFSRCIVYNLKHEFLYQHYISPESSNRDNLTMPSSECRSLEFDTALFENTFVTQVSLFNIFKII